MYLLIETAGEVCSVGLIKKPNDTLLLKEQEGTRQHSSSLHTYIKEVWEQAGIQPEDLKGIAVSAGPGSYTGLRIGVATAKGLCFALGIPLWGIGTLEALGQAPMDFPSDFAAERPHRIAAVLPSRTGEIYYSLHEGRRVLVPAQAVKTSVLEDNLAKGIPHYLIGPGVSRITPEIISKGGHKVQEIGLSARWLAPRLWQKLEANASGDSLAYLEPFYLKDLT